MTVLVDRRAFMAGMLATGTACATPTPRSAPTIRPNVLLIVADDIGFTDLGVYGSEIPTPHIDGLARRGVYFTDFHTGMTCSPTRAMLMSGVDHHLSGLGNMAEELAPSQRGQPGYEGFLNFSVAALPEILRKAGYRTMMAGKWHLGLTAETNPAARGFDRSFAMLQGGAGHFSNMMPMVGPGHALYTQDGAAIEELPADFYSTRSYTETLLGYLREDEHKQQPFFAYLAFTAPHWPIQAPRESMARFRGAYDDGYDALFERRLLAGKRAGVIPGDAKGAPRNPFGRPWAGLDPEERQFAARRMEVYAAMVADIDHAVGSLLGHLESTGQLEDTMVIFMSDNGYEGHDMRLAFPPAAEWANQCCDNSPANVGAADSYVWMGPDWSRASTPCFRFYKGFPTEGGTRVPSIVVLPGQQRTGPVHERAHVLDILPTILDQTGLQLDPAAFPDRSLHRPEGASLVPFLAGREHRIHAPEEPFAQELFGKRAIRLGRWKASFMPPPYGRAEWEIFDLETDLAETRDLAARHSDILASMVSRWEQWAERHGVILPNTVSGY